jgi:RNA polymerase sigma factor (sigma-70 family)
LLTVGRRIAVDAYRRDGRRSERVSTPAPLPGKHADAQILTRVDVERAVRALPTSYRRVLIAHEVEGFTHAEISELLGIAVGTSKALLHRARRSCRASLGSSD